MKPLDQRQSGTQLSLLEGLADIASDPAGVQTFARYLWQAKQALRQWLTCLAGPDGPHTVVCEHVEDAVLVLRERLRFLQLKTRDRGSWSVTLMADGFESLIRSYGEARGSGLHFHAMFELWLEGPISSKKETVSFVKDPKQAGLVIRKKLLECGADPAWLDDFLGRLVIRPNQPSQAHIDAVVIRELSCIWPALSKTELDSLYESLLQLVAAAQGAQSSPARMSAIASAHASFGESPIVSTADLPSLDPIRLQVLSREVLLAVTPPLPGRPPPQILHGMGEGTQASMLEMKMISAGATKETIQQAQALRAQMDLKRQMLLESNQHAEEILARLADRVLTVARATARSVAMGAVGNPVAASRPAEAISAQLLSNPMTLASLDNDDVFARDGLSIYGYLSHLSDLCFYPWHAA